MIETLKKISFDDLSKRFSASFVYAILSSIAVNFFFQPGHIYSSGATGIAQIIHTLTQDQIPIAVALYAINIPLFLVAWFLIGKKFTIFTILTVTLASVMIQLLPVTVLTPDPLINAVFGGAINGLGIGYALKNGISSGGVDIVSIAIRRKTGASVGSVSMSLNAIIIVLAGFLFGWKYALYTIATIFVSGRVTDAIFTKQKKMQVMIVTKNPDSVVSCIQAELKRGVTIINNAEGAYRHERQTVLITIITRYEIQTLKRMMQFADPDAFISISDNVKIIGNFKDMEMNG
ncbi:MAG: YitT family protein [Streptococcaceae bacterium]|jgi:uncharacterized membrane-anchored protein YitT (DUF2179 family)|nr:YitT family protein [Streptococcaceae bacterium]